WPYCARGSSTRSLTRRQPRGPTAVPGTVDRRETSSMTADLEEGSSLRLDFTNVDRAAGSHVIPCAVQNADTGEVILIAYVNEAALQRSISTRAAVFWSTSRDELWEKGATSGETFELIEVRVNCEQNALVFSVRPRRGGICHTRNRRDEPRDCFYRRLDLETLELVNLNP